MGSNKPKNNKDKAKSKDNPGSIGKGGGVIKDARSANWDPNFREAPKYKSEEEDTVPEIEKETHRLAVVNMDWSDVKAVDLIVVLKSFLPKGGQIKSVAVYPSEFGLNRMQEEAVHGPLGLFDDADEDDDDENDNEKLRAYELSRQRYYFAVVECDSIDTADYLYKRCDGVEFERFSVKLDLRFIPNSMEFKHQPRDVANESPISVPDMEKDYNNSKKLMGDDLDAELSRYIEGIVSVHKIKDETQKDGQKKNEQIISSVASELESSNDELKATLEKEKVAFANSKRTAVVGIYGVDFIVLGITVSLEKMNVHTVYQDIVTVASGYVADREYVIEMVRERCQRSRRPLSVHKVADLFARSANARFNDNVCKGMKTNFSFIVAGKVTITEKLELYVVKKRDIKFISLKSKKFVTAGGGESQAESFLKDYQHEVERARNNSQLTAQLARDALARAVFNTECTDGNVDLKLCTIFEDGRVIMQVSQPLPPHEREDSYGKLVRSDLVPEGHHEYRYVSKSPGAR